MVLHYTKKTFHLAETMGSKVNAILRGARILTSIASGNTTLTAVSNHTGFSVSTTHRLLKSLETTGFISQDPWSRQYGLGPLVSTLALIPGVAHQGLISSARDDMERVRALTKETVALVIRMGLQRVQLVELPSPHALKYTAGAGFAAPLYYGATGKVLLSQHSEDEVALLLKRAPLVKLTAQTVANPDELASQIAKVRVEGYALSRSEMFDGTISLSVPIKNYYMPVAMSVLAPENRFVTDLTLWLRPLKESAYSISKKLKKMGTHLWPKQ